MSAPTSVSDVINRLTGGNSGTPEITWMHKSFRVAGAQPTLTATPGLSYTMWPFDGNAGSTPGSVTAPTNATAGAFPFTDASGGRSKYLISWEAQMNMDTSTNYMIYDRLLQIGGLSGTVNTAQTVGGTLTRHTGGVGNFIGVEIYTQIGTTATTITASYTNQAGTSGRTTVPIAIGGTNNREQYRAFMLPLQSGDTGVQAVASVTLAATTGTAGSIAVIVGYVHHYLNNGNSVNSGHTFLYGAPSVPVIENGACLTQWFGTVSNTVSSTDTRDCYYLATYVEK